MLNIVRTEPQSSQVTASTMPQRCLLVAERDAAWPQAADVWRAQGVDREVAWCYDDPSAEAAKIAGMVAFFMMTTMPF